MKADDRSANRTFSFLFNRCGSIVPALLIAAICTVSASAATVRLSSLAEPVSIASFTDILPDPGRNVSPQTAATPVTALRFIPLQGQVTDLTAGPAWLRFSLEKRDGTDLDSLVLDLGPRLASPARVFQIVREGEVREVGTIARPQPLQTAALEIPAPGISPVTYLVHLDPLPSLWTAPILRPTRQQDAAVPLDYLLPGLLAAAAVALVLRSLRGGSQWRLWAALFAASALVQAVFPAGPLPRGILTPGDIASLLSAGFLVMLLPHTGRHLLSSKLTAPGADRLLMLTPLLGAALILLPLIPDMNWTSHYLELWPLALVPAFLAAFACLVRQVPGSLAFLVATLSPLLGMAASIFEILGPGSPILGMTGPLWGAAFGAVAFTLAPTPPQPEQGTDEPDVTDRLDDLLYTDKSEAVAITNQPAPAPEAGAEASDLDEMPNTFPSVYPTWPESSAVETPPSLDAATAPSPDQQHTDGASAASPTWADDELPSAWSSSLFPGLNDPAPQDTGLAGQVQTPATVSGDGETKSVHASENEAVPLAGQDEASAPITTDPGLPDQVYPSLWGSDAFATTSPGESTSDLKGAETTESPAPTESADSKLPLPDTSLFPSVWESGTYESPESPAAPDSSSPASDQDVKGKAIPESDGTTLTDILSPAWGEAYADSARTVPADATHETPLPEAEGEEDIPAALPESVFDLTGLLSATHADVSRLAEAKGLGLAWHVSPQLNRHYLGTGPLLAEALTNILVSTVSAVEQGSVELAVRRAPGDPDPGHLVFALTVHGAQAGQGLDMVSLGKAWSLSNATGGFFSLDHNQDGVLGLMFSARFTCTDPSAADLEEDVAALPAIPAVSEPQEADDKPEPWKKERVIIVDMAAGNRRMRANYLSSLPHSVLEAESIEAALALYALHPSGLVILDGDMPETDILHFLEQLRGMERTCDFPRTASLILTGHDLQSVRMLDAGCTETLIKPFSRDDLQACVLRLVPPATEPQASDATAPVSSLSESERLAINLETEPVPPSSQQEGSSLQEDTPLVEVEARDQDLTPDAASLLPVNGDGLPVAVDQQPLQNETGNEPDLSLPEDESTSAQDSVDAPDSTVQDQAEEISLPPAADDSPAVSEPQGTSGLDLTETPEPGLPLEDTSPPSLELLDMIITDVDAVEESSGGAIAEQAEPRPTSPPARPAKAVANVKTTAKPRKTSAPRAAATVSIQTHRPADVSTPEDEKPVVHVSLRDEEPQARVPLPDLNDSINGDMLPFVPGLSYELADAIRDAQKGQEENSCLVVQEAAERLAGKANAFGLDGLERVARCVERAAAADDSAAVSDLLQELITLTERYREAILACHKNMYSI